MPEVVIVPTGTANIASVEAAFRRLGTEPHVARDAAEVDAAAHVMLPGVGSFGASMARLREHHFDVVLQRRVAADRPTICICVGHQLLFQRSAESPGADGLGIIDAEVGTFDGEVRVPQFGWNEVRSGDDAIVLDSGHAYFANSFRAVTAPGWKVATADHGGSFVAGIERGNVVGCQFHPELSGDYGAALLGRFLELRG